MGPRRIVLDCGLRDLAVLEAARDRIETADMLFCSHAHSDHARGLWAFSQAFPQVPIYGSEVTAQLLPLNWLGRDLPPHLCQALPWQTPISLADDLTVQLWPAGHLPGAACALFTYHTPQRPYTVFYTGDFFMSNSRLVDGQPEGDRPCILIAYREADLSAHCLATAQPWTVLLPESLASAIAATALADTREEPSPTLAWLQTLASELASERIQLDTYQLTTHSDRVGSTQLIHNLRPQHVAFVHGKPTHLADLTGLEELQTRYQLHLPSDGKELEFPLGDRFIQPAAPEPVFEGEITQVDDSVLLLLPEGLTADPRWADLADTGLVQARWQGNDLVIKGLNQRDLLRTVTNRDTPWQPPSCQICRYQQEGRCRSADSPLQGLQVSPEGLCSAFALQAAERGDGDGEAFA